MHTAKIKEWILKFPSTSSTDGREGPYLTGFIIGHPKDMNGFGMTSRVKSIDFERGFAITQNTIYLLEV